MGKVLGIFISDGGVPKLSVNSVHVTNFGLVGDNQADKKHHGGLMKAVCVLENELLLRLQSEGQPNTARYDWRKSAIGRIQSYNWFII